MCSPSKSFVIIYVHIFSLFFAYCSFHNINSFLISPYSLFAFIVWWLSIVQASSVVLFSSLLLLLLPTRNFFASKPRLLFMLSFDIVSFSKMSSRAFLCATSVQWKWILLHICTHFPDFNTTLCVRVKETKHARALKRDRRHLNWNESLCHTDDLW